MDLFFWPGILSESEFVELSESDESDVSLATGFLRDLEVTRFRGLLVSSSESSDSSSEELLDVLSDL